MRKQFVQKMPMARQRVGAGLFYDDFPGDSLNTDKWETFGTSYGTIVVSGGECTITNSTGGTSNLIGIVSKMKFPVGTRYRARVAKTAGRHAAAIAFGVSPYYPAAHANPAGSPAASIYLRHGTNETASMRDEGDNTATTTLSSFGTGYNVFEIYRFNINSLLYFANNALIAMANAPGGFADDYAVYFSADGHTKPNNIIIDWVEVENA